MAEQCDKFDAMIEAIRQSAVDPNDVTVGAFAEAVMQEKMQEMAGGLPLPPGMKLF